MFRVSNFVVGVTNAIFMATGMAAICFSIYFYAHGPTHCQRALQYPLLVTGVFVIFISLLGLVGSSCKNNIVMFVYLVVVFLLIVVLIVYTMFVFFVTNKGVGNVVSGGGFKEYRVFDFSNFLREHFVGKDNWDGVRHCLVEARVCSSLGYHAGGGRDVVKLTAADFYKSNLSPIQSGCCKPPSECGFVFKNATIWNPPKSGTATSKNSDCKSWSNVQNKLCFDCDSCKAGVLANIRKEWRRLLIFNVCAILLVITLYSLSCCAMKNNKKDKKNSSV